MKKQYETPKAKKVEFDYTESVVASGGTKQGATCPSQCQQVPARYGKYFWCCYWVWY